MTRDEGNSINILLSNYRTIKKNMRIFSSRKRRKIPITIFL